MAEREENFPLKREREENFASKKFFEPMEKEMRSFKQGRSWLQGFTVDGVLYGLIMANVAVFMLWRVADPQFMRKNFMISLDNIASGRLHVLITSAFSHIHVGHIASNMIGLYFFGMNIGRAFGPEFLLKLYLAGALGGSIFFLAHKAFIPSSSKGIFLIGKDILRIIEVDSHISGAAHLGGAAVAAITWARIRKGRF